MKNIQNIITFLYCNLTSILGVLGFVISLTNLIYFFAIRRINFSITVTKCNAKELSDCYLNYLYVKLENNSQLPISLTRFRILINNKEFDSECVPHYVYLSNFTDAEHINVKSQTLPINLQPLQAWSGVLVYEAPIDFQLSLETPLSVVIATNRYKEVKTKLWLGIPYRTNALFVLHK